MTPFPLWSHKVKICGKDFNIKYRKEIPFWKMYALWSKKNPEVNDAGDSRVGVRMGDFCSKYNPIVTTRPFISINHSTFVVCYDLFKILRQQLRFIEYEISGKGSAYM